jgi:hypothetical protein
MLRAALILLALASPAQAWAEGCNPPAPLRFAPGTSGAVVEGGVPRGMPECRTITARAGQVLEASITSTEDNAVFQLHPPGWRVRQDQFGGVTVSNQTLTTADAMRVRITLPADGTYLFVIGTTRGGAEYTLRVTIR